jgi:hypothetical protein
VVNGASGGTETGKVRHTRGGFVMRRSRSALRRGSLLGVLLSLVVVGPVLAAPPPNDTLAGAINLPLGGTLTQNTTEATTDAFEQALADECGPPAVGGAVWVEFTPDADMTVSFDVSASDFSAGVFAYEGTPVADEVLDCGSQSITVDVSAGATYNLMLIGDGLTPETTGQLVLTITEAEPAPELSLTIDKGIVDRSGVVHLSGTVTCSSESGDPIDIEVFGDIRQRVGRIFIDGSFGTFFEAECDGSTTVWQADAFGNNGVFAGGNAATIAIAFGCTDACGEAFTEATLQLRRGGK